MLVYLPPAQSDRHQMRHIHVNEISCWPLRAHCRRWVLWDCKSQSWGVDFLGKSSKNVTTSLTWERDLGIWRLLIPASVFGKCTLLAFPELEAAYNTQNWNSSLVLRPSGSCTWLNTVNTSIPYQRFKIWWALQKSIYLEATQNKHLKYISLFIKSTT